MSTLQDLDRALSDSSQEDGDAWADDGVILMGGVAARLSSEELLVLRTIWPNRPLLWQKHCGEVLGFSRLDEAIEVLLDLVSRAAPVVALSALGSLREFTPARFTATQTEQIVVALRTTLAQPIGPLHRVVLEAFQATLRATGAAD